MKKRTALGELFAEFIGSMFLVMAAVASMIFFIYVLESPKSVAILANAIAVAVYLLKCSDLFPARTLTPLSLW